MAETPTGHTRPGLRPFLNKILKEGWEPRRVFGAVFCGTFIGVIPIYGFQSVAAIGIATLLGLNKPITFGATFINNPLIQPFLVISSIQLGHLMQYGSFVALASFHPKHLDLKERMLDWILGSLVLGLVLGLLAASIFALCFACFAARITGPAALAAVKRQTGRRFLGAPFFARGFVRWKLRLDRSFDVLLSQDILQGPVVDLGCGYGIALALLGSRNPLLRLEGCDLDRDRVHVASQALQSLNARVCVQDMRNYDFAQVGLILLMDVLQYLQPKEQLELLNLCCSRLKPEGTMIFRVPDMQRGMISRTTLLLDRAIFRFSHSPTRPTVLSPESYRHAMESSGMTVRMQRLRSRLPLAHILFIAKHKESSPF